MREEVGKNLTDHLCAGFAILAETRDSLGSATSLRALARYAIGRRGLLTSNICEGYGFVRSDPALELCDLELLFVPGLFVDEGLTIPRRQGVTLGAVLLQPESRGEIRLETAGREPRLVIDPRYLSDEGGNDARVLAAGVRRCLEIARTAPLARRLREHVQPPPGTDEELVEASVHRYSQTLYHPVGTCRMGSDDDSVVDPELRVRGVSGLRVVDASVMPRLIRGHTNAATMMIAARGADLIARAAR